MRRYVAAVFTIITVLLLLLAMGSYIQEASNAATFAVPTVGSSVPSKTVFSPSNTTTEKVLIVTGAADTRYLRLHVYSEYAGGRWVENNVSYTAERPGLPNITIAQALIRDRITVLSNVPLTQLPVSLYTANLSVPYKYAPGTGLFRAVNPVKSYTFVAIHFTIPLRILESLNSTPLEGYLAVNASPELKDLAANITRGLKSGYQKAVAIQSYLLNNYMYSVVAPKPPEGADPIEWFLFHSKIGDSKAFNGAFVVLARLSGLSARLVSGYKIMPVPFAQQVTDAQRAYWAEVYFEGAGWIPFDATSAVTQGGHWNQSSGGNLSDNQSRQRMRISVDPGQPVHISLPSDRWIIVNGTPLHKVTLRFTYPGNYYYPVVTLGWSPTVYALSVHVTGGRLYLNTDDPVVTGLPGDNVEVMVNGRLTGSYILSPNVRVVSPLFSRLVVMSRFPSFSAMRTFYVPKTVPPSFYPVKVIATTSYGEKSILLFWVHITGTLSVDSFVPESLDPNERIVRGGLIHVVGSAVPDGGNLSHGRVYVSLLRNLTSSSLMIGNGTVINGKFKVACSLPGELPVGRYLVVTKVVSINYKPADDISAITVSARTKTRLMIPSVVPAGNLTVRGAVVDDSGAGVAGNVSIILDDYSLGTINTSRLGYFALNVPVSPGTHTLTALYPGSGAYLPSKVNLTFTAVEVNVSSVMEGGGVRVLGKVGGIKNGNLSVNTPAGIKTVPFHNGRFNTSLPLNPGLGAYNATFTLNGTHVASLWVDPYRGKRIIPLIRVENSSNRTVLTVQLTDDEGNPVKNEVVSLKLNGKEYSVKTDDAGRAVLELPGGLHIDPNSLKLVVAGRSVTPGGSGLDLDFLKYLLILLPLLFFVHFYSSGFRARSIGNVPRRSVRSQFRTLNLGRTVYTPEEEIALKFKKPVALFVDGALLGRGKEFHLKLPPGDHELRVGSRRATVHVLPPKEAVIRLYEESFLPMARELGVRTGEATPGEIATALRGKLPGAALQEVAILFEKAKYGMVELSDGDFKEFLSALSRLGVITDEKEI